MKVRYMRDEMLALWKLHRYHEPLRADCVVSRSEGIDFDSLAAAEMRAWYLKLLAEAPAEYLAPKDLALGAEVRIIPQNRELPRRGVIAVAPGTVRIVAVRLDGWLADGRVIASADDPVWQLQRNRFSRAGTTEPVVLWRPGSAEAEVIPLPSDRDVPEVTRFVTIADSGPDVYEFDERAIGLIGTE